MDGRRIALYGKGGIGKTTVAVNAALEMARRGQKVLLIGCDPKQDTTRLLLSGPQKSILECYDELHSGALGLDSVLAMPRAGLLCCEAGGPKPGVGCAGRGVLIALEYLKTQGVMERCDTVLFDVLGDVVCGGFATPVTRGYARDVYVVTSGEQASLLAANNILSGMKAIGGQVRGLIFNARGFENEDALVRLFARDVGLPITGELPYSSRTKKAELKRRAVMETEDAAMEKRCFAALVDSMLLGGKTPAFTSLPQEALYGLIAQIEGES